MARDLIELRRSNWIPRRAQLQVPVPPSCLPYELYVPFGSVWLHGCASHAQHVSQSCLGPSAGEFVIVR